MNEEIKDRKVTDINLASFLRAKGFRMLDVRPDGRDTEFVFQAVPRSVILSYFNGEAEVKARDLFTAFKEMKGLSFQRL